MKTLPLLFCAALQLSSVALAQTAPIPAPPIAPDVVLPPSNKPPVDYPGAVWVPAAEGNFDFRNRPFDQKIDQVVVHDIEGPASSAISIFQSTERQVSAHYIVGGDGTVYQMVREHNVGYHAGNRVTNHRSIGIETEGYAYRPGWFSSTIYEAEAKLVRDITARYQIPRDRTHIIGHFEVPHPTDPTKIGGRSGHTDPGPYWDWTRFMTLVRNDSKLVETGIPATIRPGEILNASVTLQNSGDDLWPANTATNPKTALKASGPIVTLGTEGEKISPLYNLRGWIGPAIAAGAATDTLPGTSAKFEFSLRGPRELGVWSDTLRLTTVPTAAARLIPVSFGEKVTVSTRVVPWVLDVPAPDVTQSATPTSAGAPLVTWKATLPIGGIYAVYAAPPQPEKTRREKPFIYQFATSNGLKAVQARPEDGGKGFLFAGYFQFPAPSATAPTVSIGLQSAPSGISAANAGAVRLIGPFPVASSTPPDLRQIPGALPVAIP